MGAELDRAIAVVGVGAVLPDAPNAQVFWQNVCAGRYSVREVPANRWRAEDYYDADPSVADKSYSKIGSWITDFEFDWKRFRVPPRVAAAMDESQQWAVSAAAQALDDYGYPERPLDTERTGVILGTAMGGELHLAGHLRVAFPEYWRALEGLDEFRQLPQEVRARLQAGWHEQIRRQLPPITEDTMPGELANVVSGRVANVLDLRGPNFIADAACASSIAAIATAAEHLNARRCDAVLTGGVDHNMTASAFVKFCKIGALSATGSRPFGKGADGFVMGEGCAVFLLKRLADAEQAGDRIYAVLRGVGASSDGRGKGITAPNPAGQRLAMQRAWADAALDPASASLVEAHGTSTKVGDVVEAQSLREVFAGASPGAIALGSVKSNIGHLKAAAGAASLLKCVFALHERVLPPTLHVDEVNPEIDFEGSPLRLQRELAPWPNGKPRRAGLSAYGFGGTNFHLVLEEHGASSASPTGTAPSRSPAGSGGPRGMLVLGADTRPQLGDRLSALLEALRAGAPPPSQGANEAELAAVERLVIDYGDGQELLDRVTRAHDALSRNSDRAWRVLRARGIFRASGAKAGAVAFLFPGQGSQYLDMGRELVEAEPVVAEVFAEADRVMAPILGRPLTEWLFVQAGTDEAQAQAEQALTNTAITQPAVLTMDIALLRLLEDRGFRPDAVMGHSLGEYAALVAAGVLPFAHALEAAAARGREMSRVETPDPGQMAAVFGPRADIEQLLAAVPGQVVLANINCHRQCVIGGASEAVQRAMEACKREGLRAVRLPVSHAFHTEIVAPAASALRRVLDRLDVRRPELPVISNVTAQRYPEDIEGIKDLLQRQIASPVQWVASLEALYREGVRTFVEVGPRTALKGFVDDVLGEQPDVLALSTNQPKVGQLASFHHALCGLHAAGVSAEKFDMSITGSTVPTVMPEQPAGQAAPVALGAPTGGPQIPMEPSAPAPVALTGSVVVSGVGLGLPGARKSLMAEDNVERLLRGEQLIDQLPDRYREQLAGKHITRLVKSADGAGRFDVIDDVDDVIKLGGQRGTFDLAAEYGVDPGRIETYDITTQLAIAAGLDGLREAGIPLVRTFRQTTTGKQLPERWMLPVPLRDETGVIFASAFPGAQRFADELKRYYAWQGLRQQLALLEDLRGQTQDPQTLEHIYRQCGVLREQLASQAYQFDRRFIFRVLPMGHAQFAEHIGARGPNTHVNTACASSTHALSLAEDWIRAGRCRRVVVLAADDVTGDDLFEWIGSGFLATGAAATDGRVRDAALPFDRRRHGLVLGMGCSAVVVESEDALVERGMRGIAEVLCTETRNSAFHGTRLDPEHIAAVMDDVVSSAEQRFGLNRHAMAAQTLFVSHETYTPARGGSAAGEIDALRHAFGDAASQILICNTKGLTGHPMGVGIEDVVAVKALEHGLVPAVPNCEQPDPELGTLNLSRGGRYPIRYALRLAAGFGSQLALALIRRIPGAVDRVTDGLQRERWLSDVSGYDQPNLEVAQRVLRIQEQGPAPRPPVPSRWRRGFGPSCWAAAEPVATAPVSVGPPPVRPPLPTFAAPRPVAPTLRPAAEPSAPLEPARHVTDATVPASAPHARAAAVSPAVEPVVPEPAASAAIVPLSSGTDDVVAEVLRVVAEQTGYPQEMLELDLDLEADLGIDTVKQAETFAALRERFEIPKQQELSLRDYPTLERVIEFVRTHRPQTGEAQAPPAPSAAILTSEVANAAPEPPLAEPSEALQRRRPVARLLARVSWCEPTDVRLDESSRVIVMMDRAGVGEALLERLRERGAEPLVLLPEVSPQVLRAQLAAWSAAGGIQGIYWLAALDEAPDLDEIDLAEWRRLCDVRVKRLYQTVQELGESCGRAGSFLVAATRLGGLHGYGPDGAHAPLGGAVTGFCKALAQERSSMLVKLVDLEVGSDAVRSAEALLDETLSDPGSREIGYRDQQRYGIVLEPCVDDQRPPLADLGPDRVFLVSGAAGSITSTIVADLARASGGVFYLLDRAPAPQPDDADLAAYRTDRQGAQERLIRSAQERGERPTPRDIEQRLQALERQAAALAAIEAVQAAGGTAHYRSVDLLDPDSVAAVVDEVGEQHGRIDVLVHAAGIEISHPVEHKPAEEFDRVFDVKADGWFNVMRAARDLPIGVVVAFSSVAARFGNAGQTDYAAANDLLCKLASHLPRWRPDTRGLVLDWTAWADIGMASRGSVAKVLAGLGVELIPPSLGASVLRQELSAPSGGTEILVSRSLGALERTLRRESILQPSRLAREIRTTGCSFLEIAELESARAVDGTLELELRLDPAAQPFLSDHQVQQSVPYLPGVVGAEYFAEIASLLAPGRAVATVEDLQFVSPLKFHRRRARSLRLRAWAAPALGAEALEVHARLESILEPPRPELPRRSQLHFQGRLRLDRRPSLAPPPREVPDAPSGEVMSRADIYQRFFHGPAYQVLDHVELDGTRAVGTMAEDLPPDTSPRTTSSLLQPRMLELCFQTAGLWELGTKGRLSLPRAVRAAAVYAHPEADGHGPLRALVTACDDGASFTAQVVDAAGRIHATLEGYQTIDMNAPAEAIQA